MEKLLTVREVRSWIREYDNGEVEDLEVDKILELLIDNAELYIKDGVGDWYKSTPEIKQKAKLAALVLINNWYDNRDFTANIEHVSEKTRYSINSIFKQMRYAYDGGAKS